MEFLNLSSVELLPKAKASAAFTVEHILWKHEWYSFVNITVGADAHSFGKLKLPSSQTMLVSHCCCKQRFFRVVALKNIEASFMFLLARSSASLVACENGFSLTRSLNIRSFVLSLQ